MNNLKRTYYIMCQIKIYKGNWASLGGDNKSGLQWAPDRSNPRKDIAVGYLHTQMCMA